MHPRSWKIILLIAGLLGTVLRIPAWSEAIAPPPVPGRLNHLGETAPQFLGQTAAWLALRKYAPGWEAYLDDGARVEESQGYHSWTYEVGAYVSLVSAGLVSFDLRGRLMFQSAVSPNGHWYFLASSFLSDLKPRLGLSTAWGFPYLYFRHSCKHDLDQARRLIMHQGFGAGYQSPDWNILGVRPFLRRTSLTLEGEANIPAVFPDQPVEIYRWGLAGELESTLWQPAPWLGLFAQARGVVLGNRRDSESWIDVDYQFRLGVRFQNAGSSYAVYLEHEKLSDHWAVYQPKPAFLTSVGILFLGNPGAAP